MKLQQSHFDVMNGFIESFSLLNYFTPFTVFSHSSDLYIHECEVYPNAVQHM